jgi:hypothetical protein
MGSAAAVLAGQTAATAAPPKASAIEELGRYAEDAYD